MLLKLIVVFLILAVVQAVEYAQKAPTLTTYQAKPLSLQQPIVYHPAPNAYQTKPLSLQQPIVYHPAPTITKLYNQVAPALTTYQSKPLSIQQPLVYHPAPTLTTYQTKPVSIQHPVVYHPAPTVTKVYNQVQPTYYTSPYYDTQYHNLPRHYDYPVYPQLVRNYPYEGSQIVAQPGVVQPQHYTNTPYSFAYGVHDQRTGDFKDHQESRDEKGNVNGKYNLVQPDGVTRTVTYTADDRGFNAQVEYSGHFTHPHPERAPLLKPLIYATSPNTVAHLKPTL